MTPLFNYLLVVAVVVYHPTYHCKRNGSIRAQFWLEPKISDFGSLGASRVDCDNFSPLFLSTL